MTTTLELPNYVQARIEAEPNSGCWLWTGSAGGRTPSHRYGLLLLTEDGMTTTKQAHRVAYELAYGPIPDGMQIDHLCKTTLCVNPAHLEVVTPKENSDRSESFAARNARKTHCPHGHPYDLTNTVHKTVGKRRYRVCRACRSEWSRRQRAKERTSGSDAPTLEDLTDEEGEG